VNPCLPCASGHPSHPALPPRPGRPSPSARPARQGLARASGLARGVLALGLALTAAGGSADPRAGMAASGGPVSVVQARDIVDRASWSGKQWTGPQSGPAARAGMTVAIVAEDLRNGGVLGVAHGVREAAGVAGWTVKVFDAKGSEAGRARALADALEAAPDGVLLCGADAEANRAGLAPFARRGIPVVGWHTGPRPGPIPGTLVAMNISTDPLEVARVTAMAAVAQSAGRAGVVIFTDSRFGIAMAKAAVMADVIRACAGCTLLEMRDVAISQAAARMPDITRELLGRHGGRWTHALAINDIYFDYAIPTLTQAGRPPEGLQLLSAGDGSAPAFLRIRAGVFQTATVAEPLNLQGWQAVDELNRLMSGQGVSGFVAPVHLVTAGNLAPGSGGSALFDPDNGYRDAYRRIWKP
jgi:ribose transport system substrate-binding protein